MTNLASVATFAPAETAGVWGGRLPRTLAIVGSHPSSLPRVPWDNQDVEIWLFNEAAQKVEKYPRWDALIQLHKPEVYRSLSNWVNRDHWGWLQQQHGKPIYMQDVDPDVPDSVRYPLEDICQMIPRDFLGGDFHYLRSSPALALALAIYLGYDHILLYGSELSSNTEYAYQATNYAWWIGYALGRGIRVEMRCWESEFDRPVYGYGGEYQVSADVMRARLAENERAWRTNDAAMTRAKSRLDNALLDNDFAAVGKYSLELEAVARTAGETSGAMGEDKQYLERGSPISRQEYERRSAQAQIDGEKIMHDLYHAGGKCEYVWNVWRQTGRNDALQQLRRFLEEKVKYAFEGGVRIGVYRENLHYMTLYDEGVTALGGERALKQTGVFDEN